MSSISEAVYDLEHRQGHMQHVLDGLCMEMACCYIIGHVEVC